ncbi:MAG: hypothetical protein GC171_02925 [Terrimonas sp.]|nr:hypothetical protein [Terrimonas sp.]
MACKKDYSFEGGKKAVGHLFNNINNKCSSISVSGSYSKGKSLSDSNYLTVLVYVEKTGNYKVETDRVNGFSFLATGKFQDTGLVTLKLPGSGKPLLAGDYHFRITFNHSECEFTISVQDALHNANAGVNPDHFPLTDNSHWNYEDLIFPGFEIERTVTGNLFLNGSNHQVMNEFKNFYPATNQQFYRKSGNDYFRYTSLSAFTSALNFSPSLYDELNFLKENIAKGYSWYSPSYSGRTSLGVDIYTLRYHFICADNDATLVIDSTLFSHIYTIRMIPEVASPGSNLLPTGEIHTYYYAKGIGLVYEDSFNGLLPHPVLRIKNWVVN